MVANSVAVRRFGFYQGVLVQTAGLLKRDVVTKFCLLNRW